ncbi:hypothetical protein EJB05_15041, partial [Eragrostis curvula]
MLFKNLRFRYDPTKESETREHVGRCCDQLIGSIIYYARIYATIDHFRVVKKRMICDKIAGKFYLTMEEYIAQRPMWCKEACWGVLAAEWSHPDFQKRSERNRANRCSRKFKPHKGGSNSIATIRQKLERGRDVSEVEAWIYSHRGPNPEDLDSLNTEEATACLVGTFNSSSVRAETPEETLSRIAYGGFGGPVNVTTNGNANRFDGPLNATTSGGGPVNATTSGGGNYSPPEDQFPLFHAKS